MPRTVLPVQLAPRDLYAGLVLTATAADVANSNAAPWSEDLVLVARNSGATPRGVTLTSAADANGRTRDISGEAIAAGETRIYGPFRRDGWAQPSDNMLWFSATDAEVLFSPLRVPAR